MNFYVLDDKYFVGFNFFFLTFIHFWELERERQIMRERGRETGRHRIPSRLQALSHQHSARHGARTHGLQNHDRSWSRTLNRLRHPGAPCLFIFETERRERERERESERAWVGKGQGERETRNPKPAPGSELSAQGPKRGSNSWTVRSWPEPKSDAQPTEPPRSPWSKLLSKVFQSQVRLILAQDEF